MRLGDILVRDGKVTQPQLEQAIATQARMGGRLGTVLVELGSLDVETLARYLALELGVPAVTRKDLDRARDAALKLLPRDLCTKHICVPYDVRERHLMVAMRDPHDLEALDEIAEVSGRTPLPRVAPEIQIAYYLKLYYGVAPPKRVIALGERAAGEGVEEAAATPRPLPGLPPPPKVVPNPGVRAPQVQVAATAFARSEPRRVPQPVPVEEATAAPTLREPPAPPVAPVARVVEPPRPALPAELPFADALDKVRAAGSRAQIGEALLGYARRSYDLALLLLVRDDVAVGWRGFAVNADATYIEHVLVPLGGRSPFAEALTATEPMRFALPTSAVESHLCKILKSEIPREIVVAPIRIRDRVVNLLYAHPRETPSEAELLELGNLATAAGEGYARLIQSHKKAGGEG